MCYFCPAVLVTTNYALIEGWQEGVVLNQHQIIERGGIGND
jgi:hypothetical protein